MPVELGARDELERAIVAAFSEREEVYAIYLFGATVKGACDRYSDVDLAVCTNDLAKTYAEYRDTFGSVSPLRAAYPLWGDADNYAEWAMLCQYGPYQKVDFSLHSKASGIPLLGPRLLVYEDRDKCQASQTKLEPVRIRPDVARNLMTVLLCSVRFTKHLFRGNLDLYRQWKYVTDAMLVLLYERHFGWQAETSKQKLNGYETQCLLGSLDRDEQRVLGGIYPAHACVDLAASYTSCVDLFVAVSKEKAADLGIALDLGFADDMRQHVELEIKRYREQCDAG